MWLIHSCVIFCVSQGMPWNVSAMFCCFAMKVNCGVCLPLVCIYGTSDNFPFYTDIWLLMSHRGIPENYGAGISTFLDSSVVSNKSIIQLPASIDKFVTQQIIIEHSNSYLKSFMAWQSLVKILLFQAENTRFLPSVCSEYYTSSDHVILSVFLALSTCNFS